ncbi:MAG TPA: tetratricopeptide repeat protein [Clostridia bacterium]|nr:tetratricopeptide repeat protein [Clostridia bacterium]
MCCITLFSVCTITVALSATSIPAAPAGFVVPDKDPIARRGFDHFYNLEYDKAIKDFESLQKEHPDDPFVTNYLVSAVLWKELYRIGALDSESYATDTFLDQKARRPVDPVVRQRVLDLINRSIALSELRLKSNPNDADALYARGVARGMRCTYMGLGEKAWFAAVRAALGAREDHERVLRLNPNYVDAKTMVGVHTYVIGSLNWAAKILASMVGVSGNRQRGLNYLREAAGANSHSSMDAKIALALFLRREQRYPEALEVVKSMIDACPRNFLVAIEYANLLNAAGHGPDAINAYRTTLTNYRQGKYALAEPELAAFGLGVSLRGQRRFDEAAEAFDSVRTYPNVEKELALSASLAAGQMYDTVLKREAAIKLYQEVLASDSKGPLADMARKHMKKAYHY